MPERFVKTTEGFWFDLAEMTLIGQSGNKLSARLPDGITVFMTIPKGETFEDWVAFWKSLKAESSIRR